MKTLAIDYGTVRIGTAISYVSLAQPLEIIENNRFFWGRLAEIVQQHQVDNLVVGVSENEMAKKTEQFVEELKQRTGLPVTMIDETLSSYQVHEYLKQRPAKKRQQPIDHLAAAVILQNYLDAMRVE